MPLTIRPMTPGDIPKIVALEKICFTSDAWSREDFEYRAENGGVFLTLVADDGDFCGYIAAARLDEAYIDSVAVSPEKRRLGIARALLREAERLSGAKRILLEVRESNAAAHALYAGEGYRDIAKRRDYYDDPREDAVVMEKII